MDSNSGSTHCHVSIHLLKVLQAYRYNSWEDILQNQMFSSLFN